MKGWRVRIMEFMSIRCFRGRVLLPAVVCCAGAWGQQYTISTVAGQGAAPGYNEGAALTAAQFNSPGGVALDSSGRLYIADSLNHRIRMLSGGVVSTVAGNGLAGYSGDGGAATSANTKLNFPEGVAVDSAGNLYIADTANNVIRMVNPTGQITTIIGTGALGATGDNGVATSAELNHPAGVAVDSSGTIYVADTGNSEIRQVIGGNIVCFLSCGVAGGILNHPDAVAVDSAGNLYIADTGNYRVLEYSGGVLTVLAGTGNVGYSGDDGLAINAALNNPEGLTVDSAGIVYIVDSLNGRVRKILPNGTIITVVGNGTVGFGGDGGPAVNASLFFPRGIVLDGQGDIYLADTGNGCIRLATLNYPAINAGGVANAASGATQVSPGSLAAIYGTYFTPTTASAGPPQPTRLGGVTVAVNGVAAPILFVSPNQVNFQIPWETQTGTANITVSQTGVASKAVSIAVANAAPGLFLTSAGTAVAQNYPSYSANTASNPIAAGGTIVVYLTGIGAVLPAVADGAASPSSPVSYAALGCSATIGGIAAQTSVALTPSFVGLAQANIVVPAGVKSGSNSLVVTCGGQASNAAAISVK
jgi:uncharacterized protein (TIGR03437 family)